MPCEKCNRSMDECEEYRPHILSELQEFLLRCGAVSKSEAWEQAKLFLAVLDGTYDTQLLD